VSITRAALILIVAAFLSRAASASGQSERSVRVGPNQDWCTAANALGPGGELRLAPGDYVGSCWIKTGGSPGAPLVITADDPSARPRLLTTASRDNLINVAAGHVTFRGLRFGPTPTDVDAIRVRSGDDINVEDCHFQELGGIAIVANSASSRGLSITGNEIEASKATAIYIGCHDGAACRLTDVLIEGNYIHGVDAPPPAVGYGMQIKLNSVGRIRENTVVDTKGPGIMVYGSRDPVATSVVERNLVMNSRNDAGIVLGGGPAVVWNNVVVGGPAGIALENYNGRGLLRGIVVAHNTVWGAVAGGIVHTGGGPIQARVAYNASHTVTGFAFPRPNPGILTLGNVDCRLFLCFVDPLTLNFAPKPGSPLIGRAPTGPGTPETDFFGDRRPPVASAGAIDQGASNPVLIPGRKPTRPQAK
jgi:hypothetical protein